MLDTAGSPAFAASLVKGQLEENKRAFWAYFSALAGAEAGLDRLKEDPLHEPGSRRHQDKVSTSCARVPQLTA